MEKILLLGAGGHCKSVIDVIEHEQRFEIAGIIDNSLSIGDTLLGYKVLGSDAELPKLRQEYSYAFICVGQIRSVVVRKKLFSLLKSHNFTLPTIISPLAYLSKHATLSEGTILMHHALVNASAKIGKNCIINSKALVEHDAVVEDDCHISTGVIINGGVCVKRESFVGSGVTSKEYVTLEGFIKAGSLIK